MLTTVLLGIFIALAYVYRKPAFLMGPLRARPMWSLGGCLVAFWMAVAPNASQGPAVAGIFAGLVTALVAHALRDQKVRAFIHSKSH